MNRLKITTCIAATVLALMAPGKVSAQAVNNASIHGVVQDTTGAVVANAQVKAIQTDTGRVQTAISGADGGYLLADLPVGGDSLEVTAPAFSKYEQTGIVLEVGQNVQVNIPLTVGAVSQEVHVAANAAMVETQDTSVSEVIDQKRIVDLPLNGRQATDLIALAGGAAAPPNAASRDVTSHDYVNSVAISVNGGQINGNNYLLDGGDHNDSHSNINMPFPFPDALQEFSVQTSGISSRYGLHPGSVINAVTKSGTNSFHGSLFEFLRNGDFNARNFFATSQDNLHRNQFGGTGGGPIKKNKIFIFGGYQNTRNRTAPPSTISFVATPAALNGDFSTLDSAACQTSGKAKQLKNAAGQPYPNNQIPASSFSTPALNLLKLIPTSSNPCGRLTYGIPNPSNEYQVVSRVDWVQSPRNNVLARYFILDYANPAVYTDNVLTLTRPGLLQRAQSIVLGDQFTVSPAIVNNFHFTYSRLAVNRSNPANMPGPQGIGVNIYEAVPNFLSVAVSNYFTVGGGSNAQAKFIRNQWQYADDIDWIKGRYHYSFGTEGIFGQMDQNNIGTANGAFTFNGSVTGDGLADYLTGNLYTIAAANPQINGLRQKYFAIYFQDDIQLSPRLTVHAGIRWEPSLPEFDAIGQGDHFSLANFTAGVKTGVFTNSPPGLLFYGDPGIPKAFANNSYDDFAPRIGFAFDPTGKGKESVRASYGIFFDQPESFTDSAFGVAPPWGNGLTLTNPTGGFANPFGGYPGGDPFPNPYPPVKTAPFNTAGTYINLPLGLHHTYMQQWNLSAEQAIGKRGTLSLSYVGSTGSHLIRETDLNQPLLSPTGNQDNLQARRPYPQKAGDGPW